METPGLRKERKVWDSAKRAISRPHSRRDRSSPRRTPWWPMRRPRA